MQDMANKSRPPDGSGAALRAAHSAEKPKKPARRSYTEEYKQRILAEVDALRESGAPGDIGALIRREGLHWATISRWDVARRKEQLAPQKRGRKTTRDAVAEENERLRKHVEKLEKELRKAEIIIDVQKKLGALLGIEVPEVPGPKKDGMP
jgi:transposase